MVHPHTLTKNPSGGWAPSSLSKAMFSAVEEAFWATGAKAAAEPARTAAMASFILVNTLRTVEPKLWEDIDHVLRRRTPT